MQLMERNAILQNKHKSSNISRNKNQSFATISTSGGPSKADFGLSMQSLPYGNIPGVNQKEMMKSISNQFQLSPPRFSGSQL